MGEAEIGRLKQALGKQAEDMEALVNSSGGEREALVAQQLTEANSKVLELQGQLESSQEALRSAKEQCGVAERAAVRGEGAEKEIAALKQDVSVGEAEIGRLKQALEKQAEDMEALVNTGGGEREALVARQLTEVNSKVLELQGQLESSSQEALRSAKEQCSVAE